MSTFHLINNPPKIIQLTLAEYSAIRREYWSLIHDAVYSYLTSDSPVTQFKTAMKKAVNIAFDGVAEIAWIDGGSDMPLDGDAAAWLASKQNAEIGFIDELFQRLRLLRQEEEADTIKDAAQMEASRRAEGYAGTLDSVYSTIKLFAGRNKMLRFVGVDGQPPHFPCVDCRRYKNKRHKASWWIAHDAIPGSHTGFACKGYNCKHVLIDDGGQIWTL